MTNEPVFTEPFSAPHYDVVALQYTGFFSQNNITAMGEVIRLYLEQHEASSSTRRKLFSTFIEMVQNILRYSSDSRALARADDEMRFGSVTLGIDNGRYVCESTNLIRPEDIVRLRDYLETIRTMSADEIKLTYKASLRAESPVWSKGANIGLLTLARDASEPLEFTFHQVEASELSTFHLKAII
ncbi:SiaB family protein kinase [Rahnella sp. PD12R]|uniref:SiaB family protein kinase n=1 Tax=Rahnella sp. PD12R TaxID=2855688 RepID=UPI001C44339C|nr:SiaB family protein kinase [Rahnella sp. PD12R]MBV6819207.1 SiaB family protein kinase [Rahnella sp. PD12R]